MTARTRKPEWEVDGKHVEGEADTLAVDVWYPDYDVPQYVEVGLVAVRSADTVRVSYDFVRDGWRIEQAQVFEWEIEDKACDPKWKEVAFVKSWGSETDPLGLNLHGDKVEGL